MLENHCVDVELYFFGGRYASFFSACVTSFGPYNTKHGGECESLIIGKYVFFILRVEPRTMRPDLTLPNFWTCWEGEVWYWQCRLFGKTRVFFCDSALTECCVLANKTHDNKVLLRTCPISEGCGTEPALRKRCCPTPRLSFAFTFFPAAVLTIYHFTCCPQDNPNYYLFIYGNFSWWKFSNLSRE